MTAERDDFRNSRPAKARRSRPLRRRRNGLLAEAAERRARAEKEAAEAPKEVNGRDGPDPVRYGDWESRGIASDF